MYANNEEKAIQFSFSIFGTSKSTFAGLWIHLGQWESFT